MRAINVGDIDTKVIRALTGNRCMSVGGLTISDSVTQTATVTLAGTFDVGDTYTITINGTAYTYTVLAGATNLDGIATALASLVDANAAVAASAVGAVITVTAEVAAVAFTISASCSNDAAGTDDQGIAVAVTEQIATVTFGGTFDVGDVYTVTLNGTPYSHTVVAGDADATGIAHAFYLLLTGVSGFTVPDNVGAVITITKAGSFTLTTSTTNDAAGTDDQTLATAVTSTQVTTLTVGGTFEAGDVFTATLAGTPYAHTVVGGDTNNDGIATALAALINGATYTAGAVGSVVTVTKATPGSFTVATSATNGGATDDQTLVAATTSTQVATATVAGTFDIGDVFTVTLGGVPFAHTVVAGNTDVTGIAHALALLIDADANYIADHVAGVITITGAAAGVWTITSTAVNDAAGTADQTAVVAFISQTATITLTGTVDIGDVFSVTIDGTACAYTVLAADTTLTAIAAKLELLTEAVTNIASTSALGVVTIVKTGAADNRMTITSSATNDAAGTNDQTITVANTVNSVKEVETDNAIAYCVNGQLYTKAATTAVVVAGYSRVLPVSSFRWYTVQINAAGTITTVAGEDDAAWLPDVSVDNTVIGAFKVVTDATHTFIATVDALNATGITTTYFDLSCVPKLGYPA